MPLRYLGFLVIVLFLFAAFGCSRPDREIISGFGLKADSKQNTDTGHPALICREPAWDFGIADQNKVRSLDHIFRIDNPSAHSIHILGVRANCGCVVPGDFPTDIASGQSADLSVGIATSGRPGHIQKFVSVDFGSSPQSTVQLTIRGELSATPAFYCVPATLDFGVLDESQMKTRTVKISRYDGSPIRFSKIFPQSECLHQSGVITGDEADSVVEISLTLDSSQLRPGDFTSGVIVSTRNHAHPEVTIPVKATIGGESYGLVKSIFVRLRQGDYRDVPLTSEPGSVSIVEDVRFDGSAPIAMRLLAQRADGPDDQIPTLRISCRDGSAPVRLARGDLIVKLTGRAKRIVIPVNVLFTN